MNITITPTKLKGAITPPPSKSQAHRLIIAAALAGGESVISNVAFSQDIEATIRCLEQLGAEFERNGSVLTVRGLDASGPSPRGGAALPRLDCGESGSTLRFLIPVALAVCGGGIFTGRGRLMERPQKPYFDLFGEKGIFCERKDGALTVRGTLSPGTYRLAGNVSSQFITGLLYALPLLDGESSIVLTTPLESRGYVDMTLEVLERFGGKVRPCEGGWLIPDGQKLRARSMAVEADWSQAGFWYAAAVLGNDVTVTGMNPNSIQGDRAVDEFCKMIRNEPLSGGVSVPICRTAADTPIPPPPLSERRGGHLADLDVSPCPDLVPPLAAMGALMNGRLILKNAARLRIKESDRLASVTQVLNAMGAQVTEYPDSLDIQGLDSLAGGVTVDSHNDHRIAMMAAIAATRCQQPVTITGAQCVAKSYPNFWEDYEMLGGSITREEP